MSRETRPSSDPSSASDILVCAMPVPATDALEPAAVAEAVRRAYGLNGTLTRLPGQNVNFALETPDGRRFVAKVFEAYDEAQRSATTRKLLGAAAIIGGLVMGTQSNTYVGQAAATAGVFGGAYAVKSGFDKGAEVKMHSDSLRQLGESFQAEVTPMVVEVEGRTLQLRGTAEEQ